MAEAKSLVKDTAIYGMSSIIGRFLNWCLVPLYTYKFTTADYGHVTYIYSFVALLMVILTYGMETGFFRFANHERWKDPMQVYSTALISLGFSSTLFIIGVCWFASPLAAAADVPDHPSYIWMMGITVALDAYTALPFAYLRYRKRPMRFALLRITNIAINIGLNLFFILLCPYLWRVAPEWIGWFYDPAFGIGYIFLANLIATLCYLPLLYPEITAASWTFCWKLFKEMLSYSYPLLILGIAGIMNQNLDKILLPWLYPDKATASAALGIYGANFRIAVVMVMFIQAFRFAYEPFVFAHNKEANGDKNEAYRQAMKYFLIFALFIYLGVMYYLDIIKYFISPKYFAGLAVVPIVMAAEIFNGIAFNLSVWYKLTDRTIWGTWITLIGLAVTVGLNVLLVPHIGYFGSAWAAVGCYVSMTAVSYYLGRHYHPIGYRVPRLAFYIAVTAALYYAGCYLIHFGSVPLTLLARTPLLILYVLIVLRVEKISLSGLLPRRAAKTA